MARKPVVDVTTTKALTAIAGFKADAVKAIDTALKADKSADVTAQDVSHFALMHGEAIIDSGSNRFKWTGLVDVDGDRKLTDMGRQWIKEVKEQFIGKPVSRPQNRSLDGLTKFKAYNARAGMVERGCRLAIICGCYGGTSADYKGKTLSIMDTAFLPKVDQRMKAERKPYFMHRDIGQERVARKVALDAKDYMITIPAKGEEGMTYADGKFTMSQALKTFYTVAPTPAQTPVGSTQEEGTQGADTNRTDQVDNVTKRKVMKNADLEKDIVSEFYARITDKKGEPIEWSNFTADGQKMLDQIERAIVAMKVKDINQRNATNGAPKPLPSGGAAAVAAALKTA